MFDLIQNYGLSMMLLQWITLFT